MNLKALNQNQIRVTKVVVFILCLLPMVYLAAGVYNDTLGANPIEAVTRGLGDWTLRMLLITLAITPLRRLSGLHWVVRLRRMLGLFAFAYGFLHFMSYVWLDQFFDMHAIFKDILKRPFITVGFVAFILMVPLAVTSTNAAIRRMGGRRWQALHRSVYAIGILSVLHYWWLVKLDTREPLIYVLILAALLGVRAWWRELERRRQIDGVYRKPIGEKIIRIVAK